jgi:acyl-[acyl-carrier-protein]-phospholipid O-acyltransferase / long-chain-fatty-acid--[acyl-carrier-protein] ligase
MNSKLGNKFPLLALLCSQFFGAFNDNAWKIMVFTLATRPLLGQSSSEFELSSQTIATLSMLIFLVPMMFFSIPAGLLADRFSKRTVMIGTKILEVVIMGSAAFVLYISPLQLFLPFALLGMMGLQSAFFSPAKYGILPEILPEQKLAKGNGLLEMWTMIAIIVGTGMGPILLAADHFGTKPHLTWVGAALLTILSLVGLIASFGIPKVKTHDTNSGSSLKALKEAFGSIRKDQVLIIAFLGSLIYWSVLSLLGQNVLVYAKALALGLEKGEIWQGIPPAAFGLGISFGALIAARYSPNHVEIGLIPLGAVLFSISSLLLGLIQPGMTGTICILVFMGLSAGMLIVPLHTLIQARAPNEQRGSIIALGNMLDISGMLVGSLTAMGMSMLGLGIGQMLILSAFIVILGTVLAIQTLPAALVRLLFIILTRTCYRLKIRGLEHVPTSGPYVVISNHISIIDALFVMASLDRPVHFIMNEDYYNRWWMNPLARLMEAIPVSSKSNPKSLVESLRKAGEYLDRGEVVCIFPEGQVSHTGVLLPFQKGVETILRGRNCPIVPLYIDGAWGSIFSFKGGKFFTKWPEYRPYSLKVTYGPPLPASTPVHQLRQSIQELEHQAWMARSDKQKSLTQTFVQYVRQKPWALALCDQKIKKMSRLQTLTAAIVLGRLLKKYWKDQSVVAIMLPSGIPGLLCNLAATFSGRPVVNLNFTTGLDPLSSTIKQANISQIITSRGFLEAYPVPLPKEIELIYLEDVKKSITTWLKFTSMLMALFYEGNDLEKVCGSTHEISIHDTLSIIFTSGSTGYPKGVTLSHFNLHSNIDGIAQVIPGASKSHRLLHSLPLFHSFGYMMMWLGLNHQQGLIFHSNPLDFSAVGELVFKRKATLMMTTPTFLRGYMKRVSPGQFGSLNCLITGAEKLPDALADEFELQFGIRPIEGYGTTECSPVIATSTLNVRERGICQVGTLPGYVGKPLPGVLVRIIDPETFVEQPFGQQGLLLVKGPNVMQGYYKREDLTCEVLKDGWYITGDIAQLDAEGFIKITDRLSRFSKIGGEMISHSRVEDYLHQAANRSDQQTFAVTALPDEQKGEKLIVIHTLPSDKIPNILKELGKQDISNLFIPKADHFVQVKALPLLGSGKLDLKAIKVIAQTSASA